MGKQLLILPGDGIGPEIVAAALDVLDAAKERFGLDIHCSEGLLGGAAIDATGDPLPEQTLAQARAADASMLAARGDAPICSDGWSRVARTRSTR